jgi:tRNA-2-methylthio-N6-dimethylallyladenosine synthase
VRFHSLFSFKYSPRPNTLAMKRLPDDVSEAEKTRRIVALQQLQRDIQAEWFQRSIGSVEDVLVDSISRRRESDVAGRTSGNTIVNFRGPAAWLGSLRRVRIIGAAPNSLRGEVVDADIAVETGSLAC